MADENKAMASLVSLNEQPRSMSSFQNHFLSALWSQAHSSTNLQISSHVCMQADNMAC